MSAYPSNANRRSFLKQTGRILIGFNLLPLGFCSLQAEGEGEGPSSDKINIDSWIRIGADGQVTILTGKMELGQGIKTAIMQIAAEELDVHMDRVNIIIADTAHTPDERYTSGSASIEGGGMTIRKAAASARHILMDMAAKKLDLNKNILSVADGVVSDGKSSISYWELLTGKRLEGKLLDEVMVKAPADYSLVGTSYPRKDIIDMVSGGEVYVQDLKLPGMLHARVYRPPSYAAKATSVPGEIVNDMPGVVKLVRNGNFIGVIAKEEFQAVKALQVLQAESKWEQSSLYPTQDLLLAKMKEQAKGEEVEKTLKGSFSSNDQTIHALYTKPYQMHASIGPSCALALFDDNGLMVWSHTQGVYPLRKTLADLLDLPEEAIRVKGVPGAGCYGHNGADDVAADAAILAKAYPGFPIRVQWMRYDEHAWEPYGSAMAFELSGNVKNGKISSWQTKLWSDTHSSRPGGKAGHFIAARSLENPREFDAGGYSAGSYRNSIPLYDFPREIIHHKYSGPLRTSALRSLGAYGNVFALESFMDELAYSIQEDPVKFRLDHLKDERAKDVIRMVADKAGWDSGDRKSGMGIAFAQYKNTAAYLAVVVKVVADYINQTYRIGKMTAVIDAGQVINPDGLRNQTEGGMLQAASWTLFEEVKYDESGITSTNWETYPIMRFASVPEIDVHIIERSLEKPLGAGEAAQGPVGAAIANAVFNATGSRLRDLPLRPEKIDWNKL
ncbi:xanthine dehydrogenase family protein molybdopterin-binding subunit [Anditalea andensis]|uniref:Aldehyde oxidase/xanthine dehydrogenase a/b hammerhead domain-containing protein n=1 Tax=Anditalea andensis TaxID=1048983 RepID=A0A074L0Z8_9BACT|nr:molybdopterin cofactor-binding domain-containing protein [Anditalea andensis]KEO74839.1 hypothetical protein EL17_03945 [Anditalea andensis]